MLENYRTFAKQIKPLPFEAQYQIFTNHQKDREMVNCLMIL